MHEGNRMNREREREKNSLTATTQHTTEESKNKRTYSIIKNYNVSRMFE